MLKIRLFQGVWDFLSNFYETPVLIDGKVWATTEHYYQAMKSLDLETQEKIRQAPRAGRAKRLGQKVKLRLDWEDVKYDIMKKAVTAKFTQNKHIAQKLTATVGVELVEVNTWHDNIWGNCSCRNCANIPGQNLLGKILMEVRKGGNKVKANCMEIFDHYDPCPDCGSQLQAKTLQEGGGIKCPNKKCNYWFCY